MSVGYATYEDNRDFEVNGLTGNVKRYSIEKMSFPCFVLCSCEENPIEMYKINVLKNMFSVIKSYDEEESKLGINLYFSSDGKVVGLGKIYPKQVKSFLKLFADNIIEGFYDEKTKLQNEYLYVLAE